MKISLTRNCNDQRQIVIVGTGDQATIFADRLQRSSWFGLEISALFSSGAISDHMLPWLRDKRIITGYEDLRKHADENGVDQVSILLPHSEEQTIRGVILVVDGLSVEIRYVPDIFEYQLMYHALTEVAGVPVVNSNFLKRANALSVLYAAW